MKTPWFLLYRAESKLEDKLSQTHVGSFSPSRLVVLLSFIAIFLFVAVLVWFIHLIAPSSVIDNYVNAHFDAIFIGTLGMFAVYALARSFWDAFWQSDTSRQDTRN